MSDTERKHQVRLLTAGADHLAACRCGWSGPGRLTQAEACDDWLDHVPPAEIDATVPTLPDGIHVCPTCDRAGCERCARTGRGSYARVYADNEGEGRASLQLWFGAAATMELVATSDLSLAHDRVDSILATLAEAPGVVIRDRRGR